MQKLVLLLLILIPLLGVSETSSGEDFSVPEHEIGETCCFPVVTIRADFFLETEDDGFCEQEPPDGFPDFWSL